jgi:Family of unknown function (DUF6599)
MFRWLTFAALWIASAPLSAQQASNVAAEFPGALPHQFAAWTTASGPSATTSSLPQPVQQELGTTASQSVDYTNGGKTIRVVLDKFRDPSSAYSAYTGQLRVGMQASDVRPYSAVAGDQMILLIGNFLLRVNQIRSISTADLRTLALSVQGLANSTPLPPIRNYLPEERLIQGTQRYALGPATFQDALSTLSQTKFAPLTQEIGFPTGAEAMFANYWVAPGKPQTLLLIEYPTPQLAEQHLRHIKSALGGNSELSSTDVERRASLLSLVLSPVNERVPAQLRDEIRYQTQVTWNEGSHTLSDPPWLLVVKNIFLGTLAFCGLAIVLGIAFGGVRVLTKRLLPGKVFDRPEDMEVLQLGLSGKRIDPRDFY